MRRMLIGLSLVAGILLLGILHRSNRLCKG